ncbi:hypothetical protein JCM33374_g2992 [Metschnikowia sp. JCM 33374]|nr:hypothetical protein JCM33374_g2992 [Metschnikowia sp. JCM 33374]
MRIGSVRKLTTSSASKAAFLARTTVAPQMARCPELPTSFVPRSALFLSTPQNLPKMIENAITLHTQKGLQVVVAGVDRTVPNGASNGVSELWLEAPMKIGRSALLSAKDASPPLRESDGINPVGAKVHWKNIQGILHLDIQGNRIDVSLANTAFATGTLTTLFYFDKSDDGAAHQPHSDNMGQTLSSLHVKLPQLTPALKPPVSSDRWTPLTDDDSLIITKCTGNLVKGINGHPAAQYLEKNNKLMSIASKETKVYVKVFSNHSGTQPKKYEVIAGGGGWGAKADLLAISPEAKLAKGDRLEFYMVTPSDRFSQQTAAVVSQQVLFECAPEATRYEEHVSSSQTVEHLFGGGSEMGFAVNGVNYRSPGESISFAYSQ